MPNLLQKASIITIPTAYKNGKLYSAKPHETLGNELVLNGTFDTDSDWTKTNATISGGKANFNIVSGAYAKVEQSKSYTSGKVYVLTAIVNGTAGKKMRLRDNTGNNGGLTSSNGQITMDGTDQSLEFRFTATSSSNVIAIERQDNNSGDNYSFTVDNVSLKEDTSADLDFTRGSLATRVNTQKLVQDVNIISEELVQNRNFEQISSELVANGDFLQIGSELITNGSFDTNSDWVKGPRWSISGGKAICSANGAFTSFRQTGVLTSGKIYKITLDFDGSGITSGSIKLNRTDFSNASSAERTIVDGTNIFYVEATSSNFTINESGAVGTGIFDNISVKEVGQDWIFSDGATITDNGVRIVSDGTYQRITQNNVLTAGKQYKVQYEIVENNSGELKMSSSFGLTPIPSTVGTHTVYGKALQTFLTIERFAACDIIIDNISVKEVGQNWSFGTGWSIADGKAIGSDAGTYDNLEQRDLGLLNKSLKLTFDIVDYTSGTFRLIPNNRADGLDERYSGNGSYTVYYKSLDNNLKLQQQNFVGGITNISVKEITDATDLPRLDCSDGIINSLLLEPQSTNLITYSEDFSQWTKSVSGITLEDGYISPDGSNNAYKMTAPSNGAYIHQTITLSNEGTTSIYVKSDNLTGEFYLVTADGGLRAQTVTDEWTRVSLTSTPSSSSFRVWLRLENAGDSIYIWGAQLEQLPYASSYIPTNGSAATRLKDIVSRSGLQNHINSNEGVLYAEIKPLSNNVLSDQRSIQIEGLNGSANNEIIIQYLSNTLRFLFYANGVLQLQRQETISLSSYTKVALLYKNDAFKIYINGSEKYSVSGNYTMPTGLNKLSFNRSGVSNFYGKVRSLAVFNKALTNEELEYLTSTRQNIAEEFYKRKLNNVGATFENFPDFTNRLKKLF